MKRRIAPASLVAAGLLIASPSVNAEMPPGHKAYATIGSWSLISDIDIVTGREDYWMAAKNTIGRGILTIECFTEARRYDIILGDADLIIVPYGTRVVLNYRAFGAQPSKILGRSAGNGNVVIDEIADQPSFSALIAEIFIAYPAPTAIAFSLGSHQYVFPLDGARQIADRMAKLCGFLPDPVRAKKQIGKPD